MSRKLVQTNLKTRIMMT